MSSVAFVFSHKTTTGILLFYYSVNCQMWMTYENIPEQIKKTNSRGCCSLNASGSLNFYDSFLLWVISPGATFSWINTCVNSGTTFPSISQVCSSSFSVKFRLTTSARCFYIVFTLILGIIMGRLGFRGMHWART